MSLQQQGSPEAEREAVGAVYNEEQCADSGTVYDGRFLVVCVGGIDVFSVDLAESRLRPKCLRVGGQLCRRRE